MYLMSTFCLISYNLVILYDNRWSQFIMNYGLIANILLIPCAIPSNPCAITVECLSGRNCFLDS